MSNPNPPNKWKKGKPPGPGRPRATPEVVEARKFTRHEIEIVFSKFIQMDRTQLAAVKNDPNATVLELCLQSIMVHAINKGDQIRLDFVLNRLIGKTKEEIKMDLRSKDGSMTPTIKISKMAKDPEVYELISKINEKLFPVKP